MYMQVHLRQSVALLDKRPSLHIDPLNVHSTEAYKIVITYYMHIRAVIKGRNP